MTLTRQQLERLFSTERMSTYVARCDGNFDAAVDLYRWNAVIIAAFWEPIGHLEVALRNTLSTQLVVRHHRLGREATWLDDPNYEMSNRARNIIAPVSDRRTSVRVRVRRSAS